MRGSHSCKSSRTPFRTKCTSNAKPATLPRVGLFPLDEGKTVRTIPRFAYRSEPRALERETYHRSDSRIVFDENYFVHVSIYYLTILSELCEKVFVRDFDF